MKVLIEFKVTYQQAGQMAGADCVYCVGKHSRYRTMGLEIRVSQL